MKKFFGNVMTIATGFVVGVIILGLIVGIVLWSMSDPNTISGFKSF